MDKKQKNKNGLIERAKNLANKLRTRGNSEEDLVININMLCEQIESKIKKGEKVPVNLLIRLSYLRASLESAIRRKDIKDAATIADQEAMKTLNGRIDYSEDMVLGGGSLNIDERFDPKSKQYIYRKEEKVFNNHAEFLKHLRASNGGEEIAEKIEKIEERRTETQNGKEGRKSQIQRRIEAIKGKKIATKTVRKTEKSLINRKNNIFTWIMQFFSNFGNAVKNSRTYKDEIAGINLNTKAMMEANNADPLKTSEYIDEFRSMTTAELDALMSAAYKAKEKLVGSEASSKRKKASDKLKKGFIPEAQGADSGVYKEFAKKLREKGIEIPTGHSSEDRTNS